MNKLPHSRSEPLSLPSLLSDFRLLLYLFITFRLIMAMVYQPYLFELYEKGSDSDPARYTPITVERGMSSFGDLLYYYQLAKLTDEGELPYRDYWYEFPPVWMTLFTSIYAVFKVRGTADFTGWASALGLIMVAFDVGNLILLRRLAKRLHGERTAMALAWVYALFAAPVIFSWWTFETMVVFLMLLALFALVEGRERRSAVFTAVGTLTKYTPILILPTVWRFYSRKQAIRYTLISGLLVALVLVGLLVWGGRMASASLLAQFNKASYQSVWALIDNNWRTGRFTGPATRFDPDNAFEPYGNEPVISPWLRSIPFAAAGLFIFTRKLRQDDMGVVGFFTITLLIFFLWAHGWSPQWVLTLTPFILLNFPNRDGVLSCLVIGLFSFVEYPVLFMRTGETQGEITGMLILPYVFVVLFRTGMLVGVTVALYRNLTRRENTNVA